jgi:dihydrolipoamide dehydrogenase
VIGGGAIGCEFASLLADMGTKVTILEGLPSILAGCDTEVASVVQRSFKKRGIEIRVGVKITGHTPKKGTTTIAIEGGDDVDRRHGRDVGGRRRARTEDLLGEGTGVEINDRGFVVADGLHAHRRAHVFAVGDVVAGTPQLAHVGFAEAIVAIKTILGDPPCPGGLRPGAVGDLLQPRGGLLRSDRSGAKEKGYDVVVKKDPFGGNSRAQIIGDTEGVVKIIAEKRADGTAGQILGVHMAGPWVTEQLGAGYFAVNWEATAEEAAALIQPHPSLSETFGETLLALAGRGLHVA